MSSRNLINLLLLLVVAALAAVAVWEPGKEPPADHTLTGLGAKEIDRIHIEREGEPAVELERHGGEWLLTAPIRQRAYAMRAETLSGIAESASEGSFPAAGRDLSQYELEPPKARIRLNGIELAFGGTEPLNQRRYVRIGDTVHLTQDAMYYFLARDWPNFVDPALLPEEAEIVALELPGLTLRKGEQGLTLEPEMAGISADAPVQLLDHWKDARAMEVIRLDGGEGEAIRLTLKGAETPLEFLLLQREPDFILGRRDLGIAYRLPQGQLHQLLELERPAAETAAEGPPATAE